MKPDWLVIRRPGSPILFIICMLTILAVTIPLAHSSCEFNQRTRNGLNDAARYFDHRAAVALARMKLEPTPQLANLDRQSAQSALQAAAQLKVAPLSCALPFPPAR